VNDGGDDDDGFDAFHARARARARCWKTTTVRRDYHPAVRVVEWHDDDDDDDGGGRER